MNTNEANPISQIKQILLLNDKQLILLNTSFKLHDIKQFMRRHKETLEEIIIKNCSTSYKEFETIHTLFLESDLLLIDFTNLMKLEVDNITSSQDKKDLQYKIHMDKLYLHSINNLMSEFKIHLMLRQNLNRDKTKMVIKQLSFDSKNAFNYSLNALLKYKDSLRCVSFVNILDMKENPMKEFCQKMRDLSQQTEIQFINVMFSDQNILQIRYLLNWKQQILQRLVFKRIQMSEYQLQMLFIANNFTLSDLTNLKEFIFKCDEKLKQSSIYKRLLTKYIQASHKQSMTSPFLNDKKSHNIQMERREIGENYIKQKLFKPKQIVIHNQLKISQFSSFQKDLSQSLKILLFQLSQSNFCKVLDISALSLIGAPQEIISYLIKSVCDSLSLQMLKIQNCSELINLLINEFHQKNSENNQERKMVVIQKKQINKKFSKSSESQEKTHTKQKLNKIQLQDAKNKQKQSAFYYGGSEIVSGQVKSIDKLSHRQSEEISPTKSNSSANYIKVRTIQKRKALKHFTVEGNDHNIFGQTSLNSIVQMMQYSETVTLDFKDSQLTKDGIKGLLDGFELLSKKDDDFEIKHFEIKNMKGSGLVDGQNWMKFGQNLFTSIGQYLQSVSFDQIKLRQSAFQEIMRGILSFQVKQLQIKINKLVINNKTDAQMQIEYFLNDTLANLPLEELRVSSQVDQSLLHFNNNLMYNYNNNPNFMNNKIFSHSLQSQFIKSQQISTSYIGQNEMIQSQTNLQKIEINLFSNSTIKILQLNHFYQINWNLLIKNISTSYLRLEELDISDNNLNIGFISSLIFNSGLQNLKNLKKLNLSKNPFKVIPSNPKNLFLQNSQSSIISINALDSPKYATRQSILAKQKVNLHKSIDLNYYPGIQGILVKRNTIQEKKCAYEFSFENEGALELNNAEIESEENHKQSEEIQRKSVLNNSNNSQNEQDMFQEQIMRQKTLSINKYGNKQKQIDKKEKKTDAFYAKRIMSDFFEFIFKFNLNELDLSFTQLSNIDFESIEHQIQNNKHKANLLNFDTINLTGNDIRQIELFKKKISIFQDLIEKNEKEAQLKGQSFTEIPKLIKLQNLNSIKELNLSKSDNYFDFSTKIVQILSLSQCQFTIINLSENCNIQHKHWYDIILQIFSLQGKYLEQLYLKNCKFEDKHINEICQAIQYVCTTRKEEILNKYEYGVLQLNLLDLSHNPKIEKEGWYQLIKTIFGSVMISLTSISLQSCSINNIKTQYILDGLKEANLELRQNSDICLRCLEQIDLRDNPIPLNLQIDLQRSFLLSNILQSQMSQIQECKPYILSKIQDLYVNRDQFIKQIQKNEYTYEKPTVSHICIGLESAKYMDIVLPNILKSFSQIDCLVIHLDFQYLQKLTQGLDDLEQEYAQKRAEEEFDEFQFSQVFEQDEQKQKKSYFNRVVLKSVTLILNLTYKQIENDQIAEQNGSLQKKSRFNKFIVNHSKKHLDSSSNASEDENEQNFENNIESDNINKLKQLEEINKSGNNKENEDEEESDLIFNYEKYQMIKKKNNKQKQDEEDYFEYNEKERNQSQIDPLVWESILTSLYNISNFEQLVMKNCNLDGRILQQLSKLKSLTSLDISDNNRIYLMPKDSSAKQKTPKRNYENKNISILNPFDGFQQFFQLQNIQELNLSNTDINSRFVKKFVSVICPEDGQQRETLISLQTLNLSNSYKLLKQDWQILIKSILNNTCLNKLILKNCQIGRHNVQGLVNAFFYSDNTSYLQHVDLSYNKSIYPEDWGIIIVNLFNRYQMKYFDISYCAIYDEKLYYILKNLYPNRMEYLEVLNFSGNQIQNPENIFKFMNLLYQAVNIKEIKLIDCNLNKKNTEYFNDQVHLLQIRTLKTQSSLQTVYFSHNPMILESYCHSYTYFQTFLENSTLYFQNIQEINLESCLIDQSKINSFIQCFVSINSKGLKIRSLYTLNISGNRIMGEQFSEMLPLIAQVATNLQNLYIGNNFVKNKQQQIYKQKLIVNEQQIEQQRDQHYQPIQNSIQGITRALQQINSLQLEKLQISDEEEISEDDWKEFLEILFMRTGFTLQHIRIEGQRQRNVKESLFFNSLHRLLRLKQYTNYFMKDNAKQCENEDKISFKIQSIGYCQKDNPQINFILTGFNWQSFVKNGFQPEVESGHILQLDNEEYDQYFWKSLPSQRNVYVKLHNDMSIMKFEDTIQIDNYSQNLGLKGDLYIALNQLRKFINCEQFYKNPYFSRKSRSEYTTSLFLKFNYNYSKLPIFNIPDVLRAPFQFREVDLTPVLKGYKSLTFDYPLYIFFIQSCNLYPCDSIVDFFVKFIKSLSNYHFSLDQGTFDLIQASPHFFLTKKDRDNIQHSINKYNNSQEEDVISAKQSQKKLTLLLTHQNSSNKSQLQTLLLQPNLSHFTNPSMMKRIQNQRQQTLIANSINLNSNRNIEMDSSLPNINNNHSNNLQIQNSNVQYFNSNMNGSRLNNQQINNTSTNQIQNEFQSIMNKTNNPNEFSVNQLFNNKQQHERSRNRQASQVTFQNQNQFNNSINEEQKINNLKQSTQKKQVNKAQQQKLEQSKKAWTVLCPYYFSSGNMKNMEEIQIINRIQKMPPSELELKGMSISAIKTIYAFCFQNPYFTACQMDYHDSVFVNTSLASSLREKMYKNYCNLNRSTFKNRIQQIIISTLRLMIRENVFYKYDNSAIMLDQYYSNKHHIHFCLMVLIAIYHFLTGILPFIFSDKNGATADSHFSYAGFSVFTFIIEYLLVRDLLGKILHLTPGLYVPGKSTKCVQSFFYSIKQQIINQTLINYKYLIYLWYLICSQFGRFNSYSDFCFLILCLQNNAMTIFYLSCLILFINKGISIYRFINIIFSDKVKRKLPGYNITRFQETAIQLEFVAFSEVLDIISPYNVTRIPNNWFTKLFIPQISGQSINQRIYYQLLRIIFEDVPQIILQITYLIGQVDILAYISLIMSFLSFSLALYKIFSIRPSIISQLDFEELKIEKQSDHLMVLNEFEKNEFKMFDQLYKQQKNEYKIIDSPTKNKSNKSQLSPHKVYQPTHFH